MSSSQLAEIPDRVRSFGGDNRSSLTRPGRRIVKRYRGTRSSCGVHSRILSAPIVDRLNAVSTRAALSVALAVCLIPIGTAQAELFGPQYRSWEGYENAPFSPHDRSWGTGEMLRLIAELRPQPPPAPV